MQITGIKQFFTVQNILILLCWTAFAFLCIKRIIFHIRIIKTGYEDYRTSQRETGKAAVILILSGMALKALIYLFAFILVSVQAVKMLGLLEG